VDTRAVVVTGAASGIGKECANTFLADGWNVFALDVHQVELDALGENDRSGKLTSLHCDVTDSSSVKQAFESIAKQTDKLNALVCCAGILRVGALETMPTEAFDAVFAVNVRGPWLCAKLAIPFLERAANSSNPSRVIFVSSTAALRPKIGAGAYSGSKAALVNLTRAFAGELASKQILVNAVAPGAVDTPLRQAYDPKGSGKYTPGGTSPIGRVAKPSDVVAVMKFLLGSDSDYVTGAVIPVDGGTSAVRA
jgi:NAD(P)-dependent dehydrogenase (short-subunit alcohol dehydrogenase family)